MWKEKFIAWATHKKLNGESLRVLLYIVANLETGSFARITVSQIRKDLRMYPGSVSRAVRTLECAGVIRRRMEGGRLVGFEVIEPDENKKATEFNESARG